MRHFIILSPLHDASLHVAHSCRACCRHRSGVLIDVGLQDDVYNLQPRGIFNKKCESQNACLGSHSGACLTLRL